MWEHSRVAAVIDVMGEPLGVLELHPDQEGSAIVGTLGLTVLDCSPPRACGYDKLNGFELPGKDVPPNEVAVLRYTKSDGGVFLLAFRTASSAYTFVQFVSGARWVLDWQRKHHGTESEKP